MANTLHLERMSVEEKLQAMEAIWNDLCGKAGEIASPDWHEQILSERLAGQATGVDRFEDWEEAKRKIKNKIS